MTAPDRPVLLDTFCKAGGASRGYQLAGFHVIGVDIERQPRYAGDEFIQADALEALEALATAGHWTLPAGQQGQRRELTLDEITVNAGSPPCSDHTKLAHVSGRDHGTGWMLAATITWFRQAGKPWVAENVDGSGLPGQADLFGDHGLMLCGLMFKLPLHRHRFFQTSTPVPPLDHPRHLTRTSRAGHWEPGTIISVAGHCLAGKAAEALDIGWMTRDELKDAIPPAYTAYIGRHLIRALEPAA